MGRCFLDSGSAVNINALSSIFKLTKYFPIDSLKVSVIFQIGKVENIGEEKIKGKNKLRS